MNDSKIIHNGQKKIAIVHDALVVPAGSERVALNLSAIFPDAPIYTSVYLPNNTYPEFKNKVIHTLPFSKYIKSEKQFKSLFPIWYWGFSYLDLSDYDIVISSANYLAKFINPPPSTVHICYLHNPVRFLWKPSTYSKTSIPFGKVSQFFIRAFLPTLRRIDVNKTKGIKNILTNSNNIATQIQDIYNIKANVIYPPVDINSYSISDSIGDYYLYAGRLISHKRVDLAIKACNKLNKKLIIAGDGLERKTLEKMAGSNIHFVGNVTDTQLRTLYANCHALLFPSDEDFGLVPVEAQASGRPVIAFRSGGVLETVIENQTGIFFNSQHEESLIDAILQFEKLRFDSELIRNNAKRFDVKVFREKLLAYVQNFE
jgi:glycosyltransferase involved in cell wall biosynthesis